MNPDPEDPLKATIKGVIVITINHGADNVIARVQLDRLELARNDPESKSWFMREQEVLRTKP